jgi:cytochrome c peroxidase
MMTERVETRVGRLLCVLLLSAGCYTEHRQPTDPPAQPTLDEQLRASLRGWGVVPILPVAAPNAALVDLGRSLFFDKILSGNRDVACASCHEPATHLTDGMSLAVGTGGVGVGADRTPGAGRRFVPRNAPSMLNQGLGFFYMFWDGRLNEEGGLGRFKLPAGVSLPSGIDGLLAAQALLPVLDRDEMRGQKGDLDRFGKPNELAALSDSTPTLVWDAVMQRILGVPEYATKFRAAYPGLTSFGFQHAANALAAFETHAFRKTNSPFDRYLAREDGALSLEAKRGAFIFFVRGPCASCHSGPLLGGQQFANVGAPQIGPGRGIGVPLDFGRGDEQPQVWKFAFRVPALRNVELTAPYMHAGAYPTLDAVVRHYSNVDSAMTHYDVTQIATQLRSSFHGDEATLKAVRATLAFQLQRPLGLTPQDQKDLVAFLKSLTDPAAVDLSALAPASVPSGLPVRQ